MFSGIIEEIGIVKKVRLSPEKSFIRIFCKKIYEDLKLGDSISVDGVCLTISEIGHGLFGVDILPETYEKTTLKYLKVGRKVNLERSITLGTLLGGHIVLGHVDEVGKIIKIKRERGSNIFEISHSPELAKYIVKKGSITVDGISLTIMDVFIRKFSINLIPYTLKNTTLGNKSINDNVNLEADVLAKYCYKFISDRYKNTSDRYKNKEITNNNLKKKLKDLGIVS